MPNPRWQARLKMRCFALLVVLTHVLPLVAVSCCCVKSAITYLLDFVPAGSYLCDSQTSQNHQPQLVCIGNLRSAAWQCVVVGKNDRITIPLEEGLTCCGHTMQALLDVQPGLAQLCVLLPCTHLRHTHLN
ncbi:hypothetical protein AOLI_G00036000 [Acnodon oligacanthus]